MPLDRVAHRHPQQPDLIHKNVLKLLVPEQYLVRGQDPLAHPIKTFFNRNKVDEKSGKIESFIETGFKALPRQTVQVIDRDWRDCEMLEGSTHYDGPLMADGRMVFDAKYGIAFHAEAIEQGSSPRRHRVRIALGGRF